MSLLDNIRGVEFASSLAIDQIIGTFSGSFTVGDDTIYTESIPTNITESTFFQGVFSVDGGVTWNDFGRLFRQTGDEFEYVIDVMGYSTPGYMNLAADTTTVTGQTVHYKFALTAKPDQGDITPQPIDADIIFDSRLNYHKIAADLSWEATIVTGVQYNASYTHDLGYIPHAKAFIELPNAVDTHPAGLYDISTWYLGFGYTQALLPTAGTNLPISLTTTTVRLSLGRPEGSDMPCGLYLRVYYDA